LLLSPASAVSKQIRHGLNAAEERKKERELRAIADKISLMAGKFTIVSQQEKLWSVRGIWQKSFGSARTWWLQH
jgi:hypothetical protein